MTAPTGPTAIVYNGQVVANFELGLPRAISGPLVSCLMVSRGGRLPAAFAIDCYRRQTYSARELVIVTTQRDSPLSQLVAEIDDPSISLFEVDVPTLGELRNASVAHSRGELICHWDDDDLSHADRLAVQVGALIGSDAKASFLDRLLLWWPARSLIRVSARRKWEGSMTTYRAIVPVYPALPREEDMFVAEAIARLHLIARIDLPACYCYVIHGANTNKLNHFEGMFRQSTPLSKSLSYRAVLTNLEHYFPVEAYARSVPICELRQ